jgi:hypothetical protein
MLFYIFVEFVCHVEEMIYRLLRVFEGRGLDKIFRPKREGEKRKVHTEGLHNFYFIKYFQAHQNKRDDLGSVCSTHLIYEK